MGVAHSHFGTSMGEDSTALCIQKWRRLRGKWFRRFLLDRADPEKGTWLASAWRSGYGIGCRCCRAAGLQGRLARFQVKSAIALQVANFKKHEENPKHRAAAAAYLAGEQPLLDCPSLAQFRSVTDTIAKGGSVGHRSGPDYKMLWCIGEALKDQDRLAIKNAKALSLFRDERNGRLHVRYRAVDNDLNETSGTLGQARDFGTGATNITNATAAIMKRMCVKDHGISSFAGCKSSEATVPGLLEHMKNAVLCLTVDSASDETLSGEIMRSGMLSNTQQALTPGLKFVLRDKAHASRRLVCRPWSADPYVRDVGLMMAQGRNSIARLIQNSINIRNVFGGYVKRSTTKVTRTACSNMRAAAHRFESYQKPMGRTCLHLYPCIRTALHIYNCGTKDAKDRAKQWLLWLDTEKCLMLAMMADASDQGMALTRLLDDESVDVAILNREVRAFDVAITALFGDQRQCLHIFGYTSVMLRTLKEQIVYQVGTEMCSIGDAGGVPQHLIDRCLDRMKSFIVLVRAALAAEFPCWEISQARGLSRVVGGKLS